LKNNTGLIYLFTGDGKGKTSVALGTVLRAVCAGKKVAWVSWYKSKKWDISEKKLPQVLPNVDFYLMGEGFFIKESNYKLQMSNKIQNQKFKKLITGGKIFDLVSENEHKIAAEKALEKVKDLLLTQEYFLVVCDEICNALYDKLLELGQVKELFNLRANTHLILTGRNAHVELIKMADLVSEIKKIKHPYDKGIPAVKGLDF